MPSESNIRVGKIYPAICPICMKTIGTLNDNGTLNPGRYPDAFRQGRLWFCSEKCAKKYAEED